MRGGAGGGRVGRFVGNHTGGFGKGNMASGHMGIAGHQGGGRAYRGNGHWRGNVGHPYGRHGGWNNWGWGLGGLGAGYYGLGSDLYDDADLYVDDYNYPIVNNYYVNQVPTLAPGQMTDVIQDN
jgi:hypothetical protein